MTCPRPHSGKGAELGFRPSLPSIKVLSLNPWGALSVSPAEKKILESMTAESGRFSKNKNQGQSLPSYEEMMKALGVFD